MTEKQNSTNTRVFKEFGDSDFEFVSYFDIRISHFLGQRDGKDSQLHF
jgi:hypothetical protein